MFEEFLLKHCSPTLAGLKLGSLFTYSFSSPQELYDSLECWNKELNEKGICLHLLRLSTHRGLVYVYRPRMLQDLLLQENIQHFLSAYGYENICLENVLLRLTGRFSCQQDFPHEIGIFLGYPLGDVIGFIENQGQNCLCTGCWKVYCNACEAQKLFARFRKCRSVYESLFLQGRSIKQLTVAA